MTTRDILLPNNATALERALEQTTARIADVPVPLSELWDPATCPLDLLPWLAWALSTDRWETDWTEDQKRAAVANAIELQRKKGTPASIDSILASFDELLKMTEWFEMSPPGAPHTFDIDLPLISANGDLGGERSSAAFAEAIIRDVGRTKPARSHFRLLQSLGGAGEVRVIGAGRVTGYRRGDYIADVTVEPEWDTYLTTAIGEPMELPGGGFIEFATLVAIADFENGVYTLGGAPVSLADHWVANAGWAPGIAPTPGVGIVISTSGASRIKAGLFMADALFAALNPALNGTAVVIEYELEITGTGQAGVTWENDNEPTYSFGTGFFAQITGGGDPADGAQIYNYADSVDVVGPVPAAAGSHRAAFIARTGSTGLALDGGTTGTGTNTENEDGCTHAGFQVAASGGASGSATATIRRIEIYKRKSISDLSSLSAPRA